MARRVQYRAVCAFTCRTRLTLPGFGFLSLSDGLLGWIGLVGAAYHSEKAVVLVRSSYTRC